MVPGKAWEYSRVWGNFEALKSICLLSVATSAIACCCTGLSRYLQTLLL